MDTSVEQLSDSLARLDEREREIIRLLYQPLRRYAGAVGPKEIDPDDLVQEAFLRTLRQGPLSTLDNPAAYLRKTIANLASNERRRLGRLRRAMPKLAVDDIAEEIYISDLGDLMELPTRTRAVLFLNLVEGYSYKEVGQLVGCSEGAARKIASRGRRRLRRTVAAKEAGDAHA